MALSCPNFLHPWLWPKHLPKAGPVKKVKLMVKIIGVPKKLFNSVMLPKTTQALSGIESLGKNCVDSKA